MVCISILYQPLAVYAVTSPWAQSDWSTGTYASTSSVVTGTSNQITLATEEKLLNTGFDTDLSNWSEVPSYTLNDEFSDTLSPPNVNGSLATDGVNTRTVTDTNGKLSVGSGALNIATGGVGNGNPGLWYGDLTRVTGRMVKGKLQVSDSNSALELGWDSAQTGALQESIRLGGTLQIRNNGTGIVVGSNSTSVQYNIVSVIRGAGTFSFIKGGTEFPNWTLLWLSSTWAGAHTYPGVSSNNILSVSSADNIRIPTTLWLPTPIVSDGFSTTTTDGLGHAEGVAGGLGAGGIGLTRTGGTVAGGALTITPTLGGELVTNGGFEGTYVAGVAPNWTNLGSGTPTESASVHGGSAAQQLVSVAAGDRIQQAITGVVGTWYQMSAWAKRTAGTSNNFLVSLNNGSTEMSSAAITSSSYANVFVADRAVGTGVQARPIRFVAGSDTGIVDDVSLKPLTLSSLFSTVPTTDANVIVDADVTVTAGTQAGIVTNYDGANNFRIIYTDGTNIKVDDVVAGVYTNKLSVLHSSVVALNYVGGRTLRVITQGTTMRVYYNNTLVGSELSGATALAANTNTTHGLFSTYASNSFDNFVVWPRNTGFSDAPFEELTATLDASIKYAGASSVKLVAGGVDGNYLQSKDVGDTNTYNLSAYAYTDGSAVTSADLGLYANSAAVSTTYTSVGSGWYKLTGTVTGVASAVGYGVRVKAGKTVYVDDMSLNRYATSGSVTSSIFDSGTAPTWGALTLSATTPTNTTATVKVRSANTSDMSTATDFSSCTTVASGASLGTGGCVTNGHRYLQYQITLTTTDTLTTPTFKSLSISFTASSIGPSLDSPGDQTYTKDDRPTFRWKAGSDAASYISNYAVRVENGNSDFSITGIPATRTTEYITETYGAHYDGFGDTDNTNNYISVYTKNDGKLLEGKRIWTVIAHDTNGASYEESRTLYVDRTGPTTTITQLNETQATGDMITNDTTPTIYGTITDPLAGDAQDSQVASGPKSITIKIEKQNVFGTYDLVSLSTKTLGSSERTSTYSYTPENPLTRGVYRISISGTDTVGNTGSPTAIRVTVGSLEEVTTPKEQEIITEELKNLPQKEQTSIQENLFLTKSSTSSVSLQQTIIAWLASHLKTWYWSGVNGFKKIGGATLIAMRNGYDIVKQLTARAGKTLASLTIPKLPAFPRLPQISIPKLALPKISIPKLAINMPHMPKITIPSVNTYYVALRAWTQKVSEFAVITSEYWFDEAPTQISNVAIDRISSTSATISWQTNHHATSVVNYGTSTSYGSKIDLSERIKDHSITLTDLRPNTKYYFEVMSHGKNYVYDAYYTFETPEK